MEATQVPINRRIVKEDMIYICVCVYVCMCIIYITMEYYSAIKKNEIHVAICSNMNGHREYYA